MPEIRIHYPKLQVSKMKLATDFDNWRPFDYQVRYDEADPETPAYVFQVAHDMPFFFKPLLVLPDGSMKWAVGADYCAPGQTSIYPYFDSEDRGRVDESLPNYPHGDHEHEVWLYTPPGYRDNPLKRYPLLVVHDGQHTFQRDGWGLERTLDNLMASQVIDKMLVLAVANAGHARLAEYGNDFVPYRNYLIDVIERFVDKKRRLDGPQNLAVMGSSMGGLLSLSLVFDSPEIFGSCAALSPSLLSEDGFAREGVDGLDAADKLRRRISTFEKKSHDIRIYMDCGAQEPLHKWTWLTYNQMSHRGFTDADLMFLSFPEGGHNQASWARRLHLPLQFLFSGGTPVKSPQLIH
ncbi:MAG: hypothetical protein KF760_17545 [Candidatus Eremiobacteraeota bacterium]|nr:hypothetical protein [Candidatus Eremiobacteraeota bacterium]MCW5870755.1 hypothetical protein [Candidatus Eremiobacteraeota bacterium]